MYMATVGYVRNQGRRGPRLTSKGALDTEAGELEAQTVGPVEISSRARNPVTSLQLRASSQEGQEITRQ